MSKRIVTAGLFSVVALAGLQTTAHAQPVIIQVESAPLAIESRPHVVYLGQPTYYVNGHWYYRHGPSWVYYRDEPRPLIELRARPSWRGHGYHRHPHHKHKHHRR